MLLVKEKENIREIEIWEQPIEWQENVGLYLIVHIVLLKQYNPHRF